MSSSAFNLASLLEESYGPIGCDIQRLSGGYVNYTARVRVPASNAPNSWKGASAVVVKHATPYLFASGPGAPFSQCRQIIEARALALFTAADASNVPISLSHLLNTGDVRVPRLLDHCQETHLLVQEDLGPLRSVADWLCDTTVPRTAEEAHRRGSSLGRFLAAVHLATLRPSRELRDYFENDASDMLVQEVVEPLRPAFAHEDIEDGDDLCQLLINDIKQGTTTCDDEFLCLSHGDLWHASILHADDFLAVIDWEFAAISVLGKDIAQTTAYLELLRLGPKAPPAAPVRDFMCGLLDAYEGALGALAKGIQQSLRLSYGLNLGTGAIWHAWCDCRPDPPALCDHALRGVRDAAAWLRQARDGVVEPSWFDVMRGA